MQMNYLVYKPINHILTLSLSLIVTIPPTVEEVRRFRDLLKNKCTDISCKVCFGNNIILTLIEVDVELDILDMEQDLKQMTDEHYFIIW